MLFDKPLREHHPALQFLLIFSLCLASGGLFALIALKTAAAVTGISGTIAADWLTHPDPAYIPYIWWIQSLSALGLFVVPGILWAYYYDYDTPWEPIGLHHRTGWKKYFSAVLILITVTPLVYVVYQLNQEMKLPEAWSALEATLQKAENESQQTIELLLTAAGWQGLLINLFVIAILPAVGEELLFRGVLQNIMRRFFRSPHAAIWFTAFLFSALHMQWYGFLPRMMLGALFGYLYFWSGNLLLPILAHLVNNGAAVFMEYADTGKQPLVTEDQLLHSPWWLVVISLLITGILMRYLYLHRISLTKQADI